MPQARKTRLRELRGGMTQREFAESIGLSQQNYTRYESESRVMKGDLIVRICETYGCTAEWLLGFGRAEDRRPAPRASDVSWRTVDEGSMGARIRVLRKDRLGVSADELGQMLSRPRTGTAVRLWERGKCSPDRKTVRELADLFGVTVEELADGGDEVPPCPEEDCSGQGAGDASQEPEADGAGEEGRAGEARFTADEIYVLDAYRRITDRQRELVAGLLEELAGGGEASAPAGGSGGSE